MTTNGAISNSIDELLGRLETTTFTAKQRQAVKASLHTVQKLTIAQTNGEILARVTDLVLAFKALVDEGCKLNYDTNALLQKLKFASINAAPHHQPHPFLSTLTNLQASLPSHPQFNSTPTLVHRQVALPIKQSPQQRHRTSAYQSHHHRQDSQSSFGSTRGNTLEKSRRLVMLTEDSHLGADDGSDLEFEDDEDSQHHEPRSRTPMTYDNPFVLKRYSTGIYGHQMSRESPMARPKQFNSSSLSHHRQYSASPRSPYR